MKDDSISVLESAFQLVSTQHIFGFCDASIYPFVYCDPKAGHALLASFVTRGLLELFSPQLPPQGALLGARRLCFVIWTFFFAHYSAQLDFEDFLSSSDFRRGFKPWHQGPCTTSRDLSLQRNDPEQNQCFRECLFQGPQRTIPGTQNMLYTLSPI